MIEFTIEYYDDHVEEMKTYDIHADDEDDAKEIFEDIFNMDFMTVMKVYRKDIIEINGVGNHYGSLNVKSKKGKYFMKVFCQVYPRNWIEIDEKLYVMLVKLNENQKQTL